MTSMHERVSNERGVAMVLVLGVLAALAVLAMVVLVIVVSEKRTSSAEYSNDRSFYSADAAGEAGIAWIRRLPSPPSLVDTLGRVSVAQGYRTLSQNHRYKYDVKFVGKQVRPGWSVEYTDYEYEVQASGTSAPQAEAAVELKATRMFREGY
jgi:Tfp pilus assembly protein PilX